jgi:hypothetical protein
MPRKNSATAVTSAFLHVQHQARALLMGLHKEIRVKEGELARLKEEESRLGLLVGSAGVSREARPSRGRAGRINWRAVLKQLPKQFKASDVRAVRGLKGKRPSEIFAAVTRWINAGLAKRKTRGLYEKIGS